MARPIATRCNLAAGKLARVTVEQMVDAEHLRRAPHLGFDFRLGRLAGAQAEGDVVEHPHVRIERVVLEHHCDIAFPRRQVIDDLAAYFDGAPVGILQPGDCP